VGLFGDKVSLERLKQEWLLYPTNIFFMECAIDYEGWKNVYMWLLKKFRVQRIISTIMLKYL
jgi:hypothetical protein